MDGESSFDFIPWFSSLDQRERAIHGDFRNPAAMQLRGSLQLQQGGVDKIAGSGAESFLQTPPPDLALAIWWIGLGVVGSDAPEPNADCLATLDGGRC